VSAPAPEPDRLRDGIDAVGLELSMLASRVGTLRRRMEQLSVLREEEVHAAARMARLERVLEVDRVAGHLRRAVNGGALVAEPVPHLVAPNLLPPDVYQVLLEAVPPPVFFEGPATERQELRVPPRLAPSPSIVTWMFVNDVVLPTLIDVLVARCAEPLARYTRERFPTLPPLQASGVELGPLDTRIVRRTAGCTGGTAADRRWDLATGMLFLSRPEDTDEYGSCLQGVSIPFHANSALAYVAPAEAHAYATIPSDAPGAIERYTYEFGIGPTKQARQTLTTRLKQRPAAS